MEILGVFNERAEIVAAAKREAEPYLDNPVKAWTVFAKYIDDHGQRSIELSLGTVQVLRPSITAEQVRGLIGGFK